MARGEAGCEAAEKGGISRARALLYLASWRRGCGGKKRVEAERLEIRTGVCGIAAGGHLVPLGASQLGQRRPLGPAQSAGSRGGQVLVVRRCLAARQGRKVTLEAAPSISRATAGLPSAGHRDVQQLLRQSTSQRCNPASQLGIPHPGHTAAACSPDHIPSAFASRAGAVLLSERQAPGTSAPPQHSGFINRQCWSGSPGLRGLSKCPLCNRRSWGKEAEQGSSGGLTALVSTPR